MHGRHFCSLAVALTIACATNAATDDAGPPKLPRGITYQERAETYRVIGTDRATIGQGIRAAPVRNGQGFAGYYEWRLDWHWNVQGLPGTLVCGIVKATVSVKSVVTLPEWTPPPGADAALVEEWQRYVSALTAHEAGHRDLVLAGAKRIHRAIRDVPAQDCPSTHKAALQVVQKLLAELKLENERYDETTRHGATQGAVWAGTIEPSWPAK